MPTLHVPYIRQFQEAQAAVPSLQVPANRDRAPSPLRLHANCDSAAGIQDPAKW